MSVKQGKKVNKQAKAAQQRKTAEAQAAQKAAAQKSAKKSPAAKPTLTKAEDKKRRQKRIVEIGAIVFAVIMALTMMLPSLSAIFSNSSSSSSSSSSTTDASTDASTDSSTDSSTTTSTSDMASVDSKYSSTVSTLESKLDGDPNNLAALINVANDYLSWGYSAMSYESTDDDKAHVADLFTKAMGYYDRYLALNDAKSAHTNRALAQFYSGDTTGAISYLESYVQTTTDYAAAWADLGMMYESSSETDKAKDAYTRAISAATDDDASVKSYAEGRLSSIVSSESSTTSSSSASSSSSSSSSGSLLSDLQSSSGTTL